MKKAGHTQSEITTVINQSVSTISRTLSRNRGARGYRPKQAYNKAVERKAINTRAIDDDWQANTIIDKNHRQAIVSLVERKTGYTLIRKVERKTVEAV